MNMTVVEKVEIHHIDPRVAKKLHKKLVKLLGKYDDKKIFEYDINAHSDFCVEVIKMMDIMIGQVADKYKK